MIGLRVAWGGEEELDIGLDSGMVGREGMECVGRERGVVGRGVDDTRYFK